MKRLALALLLLFAPAASADYIFPAPSLNWTARDGKAPQAPPREAPQAPPRAERSSGVHYLRINPEHRIPNRTGIQCVYSSLETLARHHGMSELYDLTAKYRGMSGPGVVRQVLSARGVKFEMNLPGRESLPFIRKACEARLGCLIGVGRGAHAIVCCGVDATSIYVIDNSDRSLRVQRWTLDRYRGTRDGWAVVLYPKRETLVADCRQPECRKPRCKPPCGPRCKPRCEPSRPKKKPRFRLRLGLWLGIEVR